MKRFTKIAEQYLFYYILALVLLMPVHAFMTISLGHLIGHQAWWQAWKEIGLVLGGLAASILIATKPRSRQQLSSQPAIWSAAAYIGTSLLVSGWRHNISLGSFLLGAKTSLAFLILFIIIQTVTFDKRQWQTVINALLVVSSAVGLFAVAQVYLLPVDWLTRFGYGASTVLPFHLVDPAVSSIRIIATFSGPNQLGSFMIIPLIISLGLALRKKWLYVIPAILSGFALFHSYSRSSWIAAVVALFVILVIRLRGWWKLSLLAPLIAMYIIASVLNGPVRSMSTKLTFYVFHGQFVDGHTNGSDSYRLQNARAGLDKIKAVPAGYGLGTAGPASQSTSTPIITENYYLQVGIESGVIGLSLFVLTIGLTLLALYKRFNVVDDTTSLFGVLVGLCVANLFLHTWADSATALVLCGLVGYSLTADARTKA